MPPSRSVSRADYGQFVLSTQTSYTQTYFGAHHNKISHDALNRWMAQETFTSALLWEHAKPKIIPCDEGYLVFDDTVLDKNFSRKIELVRRQYSGNAHGLIKGIGVVNCVYVNPTLGQFWVIDYRLFAPQYDGKTKLDHMREMFDNVLFQKKLPFRGVLMDTWYATADMMQHIHKRGKFFYCPIKSNRRVKVLCYAQKACDLEWSEEEKQQGMFARLHKLDKKVRVKFFRVVRSTTETETIVTNDCAQSSTAVIQDVVSHRWKVEQFHRELKQTTGIEACQCRKHRAQRTHIAVCMLVWLKLTEYAHRAKTTIYQLKQGLLDDYMKQQLLSPNLRFA
jgi:hypothetical protein